MKYIQVGVGNGYCGCDESFLLTVDDSATDKDIAEVIFDCYTYSDGAAGIDPDDPDEFNEDWTYYDQVMDNIFFEEITKAEHDKLVAEGWEER